MKTLSNELVSYRPTCTCGKCTCGGTKDLANYFQTEHFITFLMELDKSFIQIRTQLLLIELEPTINHSFSLVVQ